MSERLRARLVATAVALFQQSVTMPAPLVAVVLPVRGFRVSAGAYLSPQHVLTSSWRLHLLQDSLATSVQKAGSAKMPSKLSHALTAQRAHFRRQGCQIDLVEEVDA